MPHSLTPNSMSSRRELGPNLPLVLAVPDEGKALAGRVPAFAGMTSVGGGEWFMSGPAGYTITRVANRQIGIRMISS